MATTTGADTRTPDPVPVTWQRLAALAGLLFSIALALIVALTYAEPPDHDATGESWNIYAEENQNKYRYAAMLTALAVYQFAIWIGYLRGVLTDAETRVRGFSRMAAWPLVGGILGIAGFALGVFTGTAALAFADANFEIIRGLTYASTACFGLAAAGFATMLISFWFVQAATDAIPRYLGWVALAGGICFLLSFGILLDDEYENAFDAFTPISLALLAVFTGGSAVHFFTGLEGRTDD